MKKAFVVLVLFMACAAAPAAETKIGPKGQVLVNGKAVIPLGVWTQPTYLFEYHRHLGLNCIVNVDEERGAFRDIQDTGAAAAASKLGLVVGPWVPDSPAVWARLDGVLFPRRGGRGGGPAARPKADPNHILMVNIPIHSFLRGQEPNYFAQALRNTDAVISHVWPQCEDPNRPDIRNVGTFVDLVRKYCKDRPGGEVCIWPDINPHGWTLKKAEGGLTFPPPTPEELRFQIWLALIHGADGLCFFPITFEPMFVYSQIPARNEQELARNSRLIEKMTPALTADESPLKIEVVSDQKDGILDWTTRTVGGRHYLFLLNGQRQEQTVTVAAPDLGAKWQLRDAVKDAPVSVSGGKLSEKLPGLGLRIWELAPAGTSTTRPARE
jgi:hypothetical protein